MSAVYLNRTDSSRSMARYYAIRIQPTLFGEWTVLREWGRIGQGGSSKSKTFADASRGLDLRILPVSR